MRTGCSRKKAAISLLFNKELQRHPAPYEEIEKPVVRHDRSPFIGELSIASGVTLVDGFSPTNYDVGMASNIKTTVAKFALRIGDVAP
jgi:hypothetical protein